MEVTLLQNSADQALAIRGGSLVTGALTRAREYANASRASGTQRAYAGDWRHFEAWCLANAQPSLPASPESVAAYLGAFADSLATMTLRRRLAAISVYHSMAEVSNPTRHAIVKAVWSGIRRTKGVAQQQKAAVTISELRRIVTDMDESATSKRDRALLLLGFASALRRSELVALNVEDAHFEDEGIVLTIRRSKTDQEAEGRHVAVPYGTRLETCPVRALRSWLEFSAINHGAIFTKIRKGGIVTGDALTPQSVALVIKRHADRVGLDPSRFAGHSLRSGFCTAAAAGGASEASIMQQSGHRSIVVARRYIRRGNIWRDLAAHSLGL